MALILDNLAQTYHQRPSEIAGIQNRYGGFAAYLFDIEVFATAQHLRDEIKEKKKHSPPTDTSNFASEAEIMSLLRQAQ
jgi:hypothetical protein